MGDQIEVDNPALGLTLLEKKNNIKKNTKKKHIGIKKKQKNI